MITLQSCLCSYQSAQYCIEKLNNIFSLFDQHLHHPLQPLPLCLPVPVLVLPLLLVLGSQLLIKQQAEVLQGICSWDLNQLVLKQRLWAGNYQGCRLWGRYQPALQLPSFWKILSPMLIFLADCMHFTIIAKLSSIWQVHLNLS